jgi:predicted DNA-binding transcriptional regulator YafY
MGFTAMKIASRVPLRRLVALDDMVRKGGYPNATSAALDLEVHPRTIARDLDFLRNSWGAPLEFSHARNGYFYRDPDYLLPFQRLSEGELVALFLAERVMQQYKNTPYAKDLATAFQKITFALPEEVTINLNHLRDAFSFRQPAERSADLRCFKALVQAVRKHRRLELLYWTASRDETLCRVIDPYHLASVDGDWYMIGYCHLREDIRMFAPGRIRSLRETGEEFDRPASFRADEYLEAGFRVVRGTGKPQCIRLLFSPEVARYVRERQWHPTEKRREHKDGSLELTLSVNHLLEVKRWVLSHGSACEVLEPAELRELISNELVEAASQYKRKLK